jgi:hypothetical protein
LECPTGANDEIMAANDETGAMNDEICPLNDETGPKKTPPARSLGLRTGGVQSLRLFVFFGFHVDGQIDRSDITVLFLVDGKAAV